MCIKNFVKTEGNDFRQRHYKEILNVYQNFGNDRIVNHHLKTFEFIRSTFQLLGCSYKKRILLGKKD